MASGWGPLPGRLNPVLELCLAILMVVPTPLQDSQAGSASDVRASQVNHDLEGRIPPNSRLH